MKKVSAGGTKGDWFGIWFKALSLDDEIAQTIANLAEKKLRQLGVDPDKARGNNPFV